MMTLSTVRRGRKGKGVIGGPPLPHASDAIRRPSPSREAYHASTELPGERGSTGPYSQHPRHEPHLPVEESTRILIRREILAGVDLAGRLECWLANEDEGGLFTGSTPLCDERKVQGGTAGGRDRRCPTGHILCS